MVPKQALVAAVPKQTVTTAPKKAVRLVVPDKGVFGGSLSSVSVSPSLPSQLQNKNSQATRGEPKRRGRLAAGRGQRTEKGAARQRREALW